MKMLLVLLQLTSVLVGVARADYFDGNSLNQLFRSDRAVDEALARGYVGGIQDTYNGHLFCVHPEVKCNG